MKYPLFILAAAGLGLGLGGNAAAEMMQTAKMSSMKSMAGKSMAMSTDEMSAMSMSVAATAGKKGKLSVLDTIAYNIEHKGLSPDDAFVLALQNPQRPMAERLKDLDRKPLQVLEFAGIKPGMRVLNLLSYYGYYAEVLAYRVGKAGQVLAHNTPVYASTTKNIKQRLETHPLENVVPYAAKLADIELEQTLDAIMFMSSYHDFYGYLQQDKKQRIETLKALKKALKPGGKLIVSDMVPEDKVFNGKMHRIDKDLVLAEFIEAGYRLVGESEMLRKPTLDDHKTIGYDKARFYTDRWLMKLAPSS